MLGLRRTGKQQLLTYGGWSHTSSRSESSGAVPHGYVVVRVHAAGGGDDYESHQSRRRPAQLPTAPSAASHDHPSHVQPQWACGGVPRMYTNALFFPGCCCHPGLVSTTCTAGTACLPTGAASCLVPLPWALRVRLAAWCTPSPLQALLKWSQACSGALLSWQVSGVSHYRLANEVILA